MLHAVASEKTPPAKCALVFKLQSTGFSVCIDDGYIKVDQMRVIPNIALCIADAVRVVTGRAWRLFVQVLVMLRKTLIGQNTVATVTLVTQLIGRVAFGRIIGCFIPVGQQRRMSGSVGPPPTRRIIGIMTICTANAGRRGKTR